MTYGSSHYWASEDLNTTGENVGITLDSMCDIIAANDVTNGNTVVFVPGDIEHGEKGHFALGEGSGGSAEIDADLYQVLTGDGEGNGIGAQGGSSAIEANKIYLKDKRLGPNIPTQQNDGTPIQDVETGSFTITSNALNHTHTENVYDEEQEQDVQVQVEDDGWRATFEDYGQLKVSGGATVNIGETGTVYSGANQGKFWNKGLRGPEIDVTACAKVEMIGNGQNNATPVLSMRGNCIIDMADESTPSGTKTHIINEISEKIRKGILTDWYSTQIFNYKDSRKSAPVLQLKDRGTASFTDSSILSMRDAATAVLQGDCFVKITGANYSDNPKSTSQEESGVLTYVNISPNSIVNMDGSANTSILHIGPNQVFVGTMGPLSVGDKNYHIEDELGGKSYMSSHYGSHFTWPLVRHNSLESIYSTSCSSSYESNTAYVNQNIYSIKKPCCDYARLRENFQSFRTGMLSEHIKGPGFAIESRAGVLISSEETSLVDIVFQTDENAVLSHSESIDYGGNYSYHIGVDNYGVFSDEVNIYSGATVLRKFTPRGNCTIHIDPDDGTSVVLHTGKFGLNMNTKLTDIQMNYDKFQGIFDGDNCFVQVDGNTHVESWSANVVLRGLASGDPFTTPEGRFYPKYPEVTNYAGTEGSSDRSFYQYNEALSFTKQQLLSDYQDWIKAASPCPESSTNGFNPIDLIDIDPYTIELSNDNSDNAYFVESAKVEEIVTLEKREFVAVKLYYTQTALNNVDEVINYYNTYIAPGSTTDKIINNWQITQIEKATGASYSRMYYGSGYYWYYLKNVYVHRKSTDYVGQTSTSPKHAITSTDLASNRIYNPDTDPSDFSQLTQAQQDWFLSVPIKYLGNTSIAVPTEDIDYSNVAISGYYLKQNWRLTCTSIWKQSKAHLNKDWLAPLQTSEYALGKGGPSPIIQMYGAANFLMRGKFSHNSSYVFESSETYDVSNIKQAIEDFIAGPDYADFEANAVIAQGYELWEILDMKNPEPGHYSILYSTKKIGWHDHLDSFENSPVFEITDDSELRLYGGTRIKAETKLGETTVTISGDVSEGSVSFTISELQALKALISNT